MYEHPGGHEIYDFISRIVVMGIAHGPKCIAALRAVDTEFRARVDAYILKLMPRINECLSDWYSNLCQFQQLVNDVRGMMPHPRREQWKEEMKASEMLCNEHRKMMECKLSYHSTESLKKHLNQTIVDKLRRTPSPEQDAEFVVRFSNSVKSYLTISAAHACEFHKNERCECVSTWGGSFAFVPHGRGLLVRCAQSCLGQHCVQVRCFRSEPVSTPDKKLNPRNMHMAQAMMTVAGVHAPFSISAVKARIGIEGWDHHLERPYNELLRRNPRSTSGVLVLTTNSDATDNDTCSFQDGRRVPTFQSLLRLSQKEIGIAQASLHRADAVIAKAREHTRVLMKEFAAKEFLNLLNLHFSNNGRPEVRFQSLEELNDRFAGAKIIIDRSILDHAAQTPMEEIYNLHLMNRSFTLNVLNAIYFAAVCLRDHDLDTCGRCASDDAYSFASGLCSGLNPSHDHRDLNYRLNFALYNDYNIISKRELDSALILLHAFDKIDPLSVTLQDVPTLTLSEMYQSFLQVNHTAAVCQFEFVMKIGCQRKQFSGPVAFQDKRWYVDVQTALESARQVWMTCCKNSCDESDLKDFESLPGISNSSAEPDRIKQHNLQELQANVCFFMKFVATRAIAFDLMTNNRARSNVCDFLELRPELRNALVDSLRNR